MITVVAVACGALAAMYAWWALTRVEGRVGRSLVVVPGVALSVHAFVTAEDGYTPLRTVFAGVVVGLLVVLLAIDWRAAMARRRQINAAEEAIRHAQPEA